MNKKFGWIFGTLVVAIVAVGALGTSVAYAHGGGPGDRLSRLDAEALKEVADLLGMAPDEVIAAIKDEGKTLQELADEAGVDIQTIKDTLADLRSDTIHDRSLYEGEALDVIAELLGMNSGEVTQAIKDDGKSLQDLADEVGVDMQEIKDALSDLRTENVRERIETALDAGTLTEDEANWLLEGLDNGYLEKLGKWFVKRGGGKH